MKQIQKLEHNHLQQKWKEENIQSNLKPCILFYVFHLLAHYILFLLKANFLFHLFF